MFSIIIYRPLKAIYCRQKALSVTASILQRIQISVKSLGVIPVHIALLLKSLKGVFHWVLQLMFGFFIMGSNL